MVAILEWAIKYVFGTVNAAWEGDSIFSYDPCEKQELN